MDLCEDAYITTSNPAIISVWIGLLIQNILCIGGLSVLSYLLIKYKIYHPHLRYLILALHFAFLLRTIGTTYRGGDFLVKLITKGNDNCNLLQKKTYCKIISSINGASIGTFLYTFAAISLERIIALLFYKKYEKHSFFVLPLLVIVAIWAQPIKSIYDTLSDPLTWNTTIELPYCNSFSTNVTNIDSFVRVDLPISITVFLINLFIFFYSKYRLKKLDDIQLMDNRLTVKFQLKELSKSSKTVAILGILYSLDLSINLVLVYTISITIYTQNKTFAFDKELSAYIIPIYILIYIVMFSITCDKLKEKIFGLCCQPRRVVLVANNKVAPKKDDVEEYFKIYNNNWS
uniref:G_PROTEIN_RECEP_F1_2 domain-containing protein n=1 Tax=Parastrongyloides trichosuri TaxID=131310 RepID=A0A0N4ZVK0_PARTI